MATLKLIGEERILKSGKCDCKQELDWYETKSGKFVKDGKGIYTQFHKDRIESLHCNRCGREISFE